MGLAYHLRRIGGHHIEHGEKKPSAFDDELAFRPCFFSQPSSEDPLILCRSMQFQSILPDWVLIAGASN